MTHSDCRPNRRIDPNPKTHLPWERGPLVYLPTYLTWIWAGLSEAVMELSIVLNLSGVFGMYCTVYYIMFEIFNMSIFKATVGTFYKNNIWSYTLKLSLHIHSIIQYDTNNLRGQRKMTFYTYLSHVVPCGCSDSFSKYVKLFFQKLPTTALRSIY